MLSKLNCVALTILLAIATLAGCTRIVKKGTLIDRYSTAECIPVERGSGPAAPARVWGYTLATREGVTAHISGLQMPGGRIDVKFASDGEEKVAANAGDYVYPADVRFDASTGRLYVKASGLAVLDGNQTWLFEYDLNKRRQIERERVDPQVLPQECPIN